MKIKCVVTSVPYRSTKMVIFSGVPLAKDSYKTHSGKYYVTIKADPDSIPVQPTLGQHWSALVSERHSLDRKYGDR
ncbi:hypothetical protein [Vibrio sp. ES.051]|uniref:hypothetical protein n=1 Tax=Vibrio sp. ES.051 TaxID=1761909 RepID=UPI00211DA183|nr:hypothetical protein [Vibrio sp. ES.051]